MSGLPAAVLVADPPWKFGDRLPGPKRGAAKHYDVMDLDDIKAFPLPLLADDCYLFLWRVSSMVEEAYAVCRAWGFAPKTELVWIKQTVNGRHWFGMGHHLRAEHETCIVAVRGRPKPLRRNIRSTFTAPATVHSAKPDAFYDLVEQFAPGPYDELFARRWRPGWMCYGNELPGSTGSVSFSCGICLVKLSGSATGTNCPRCGVEYVVEGIL